MKKLLFCILFTFSTVGIYADGFEFAEQDGKKLTLRDGETPVLTYQFDAVPHDFVPEKSARNFAGCYIHPLYGLDGEILTDNAPIDHYHHHGVFWTYPHVGIHEKDGTVKEYDLWQGMKYPALKQRFVKWLNRKTTEDYALFEVQNGWFITEGADKSVDEKSKMMDEHIKVIVHKTETAADGLKSRAVDIELTWKPLAKPVSLRGAEGKSYGGLTLRFKPYIPEEQLEKNPRAEAKKSEVNVITVPSGVAEKDLPEMPLAWADYTSHFGGRKEPGGAALFVSKDHPDYPPTWLTRYYGPLCIGYPGVKDKTFLPGEEIKLRYRIWIHGGAVSKEQIENAYQEYTMEKKPEVKPEKVQRKRLFRR
ncbi:MAG: PmoA family protein [Planctomycetaceae bacterium]|nr:PmoA family protein [Planctomycetaceae bacterium]